MGNEYSMDTVMISLQLLWQGMLGILVTAVLIMSIVMIMQRISRLRRKYKQGSDMKK